MGMTINEKKRVRRELVVTAWGAQLEGDVGWVGAPRHKLLYLMYLTALLAIGGVCSEDILGTVNGVWAYVLTFRRSLFSLMFHVYRCASPDGCRGSPFRLGTWSRNELLLLSILGPFSLTDMRADFDPVVYAADASPYGLGVVAAEVGKPVVAELWRRADVQGRTRHLLHALSASLREIGQGNWDDLLAEEDLGEDEFLGRNDAGGRIYNDEGVKANCNSVLLSFPADGTRFAFGADPCYNMIDRKATNEMKGPPLDKFPVCFEVIEVCGGIGGIGDAALKRGCRTLNMELKLGWDVLDDGVLRWLIWMCISGRCFFLMLEPPCTTMSLARKPGLRSSRVPWGFDVYCKKTAEGFLFWGYLFDAWYPTMDVWKLLLLGAALRRFHEMVPRLAYLVVPWCF